MNAVVTGASGHLGVNFVRALIARGYRVKALIHQHRTGLEHLPVERVPADILEIDSLLPAFKKADVVFHLAARISIIQKDYRRVEAVNINGVRNVIEACLAASVNRLVHVSSIHAFNQRPMNRTLDETRDLVDFTPRVSPYDRSKAEGERLVKQAMKHGLNAVILNPTGVIGPYDYQPSHFGASLMAIASGKMPVNVNAGFNWVDVRDVTQAAITAAETAGPGEQYLLAGHWVNMVEIAALIRSFTGSSKKTFIIPLWLAKMSAPLAVIYYEIVRQRPLFTVVAMKALESNRHISHAKATRDLNYQPRPFEVTIQDTLEWFQNTGYLKRGS